MAYTGSGSFVGITAGYSSFFIESVPYDYGYGIVFGQNQKIYCAVGARYFLNENDELQKVSLSITSPPDESDYEVSKLVLRFPSLQKLRIKGYAGYTGTIKVVSGIDCDIDTYTKPDKPIYSTYRFHCGFLVQRTDNT